MDCLGADTALEAILCSQRLLMEIYFLKLNQYSILPMLFFRLIGYKVYFLDCGQWWKKKAIWNELSRIGLVWMSHQEYGNGFKIGEFERDLHAQSMRIGRQLFALENFQRLVDAIGKEAVLQPTIYQRVFSDIFKPTELIYLVSQHSLGVSKPNGKVWIQNTIITRSLLDVYPNISNMCPRIWTAFEWIFNLSGHIARKLPELASRGMKHFSLGSKVASESNQFSIQSDTPTLENVEVAYFPHQGVFFGNLFLKDHFYAAEKNSPFYYKKIAHFELNGNGSLSPDCLEYYRAKNIKNYDWHLLPFNKTSAVRSLIQFLSNALRHGFGGFDIDLLVKHVFIVWSVQTSMLRLQNLPNLKVVLIGYDILFPQPLSIACRLAGIKTVAVQERMLVSWIMMPLLIDHYFVVGPKAHNYLKSHAPSGVSFYELGPVRLKDHAKARIPAVVATIREKYSWIVLALDFHSDVRWFEGGNGFANNWRSNMIFYDLLLRLCGDFPDAFFLLKGKNTDFTKIPFFRERVDQFRAQPNLLILEDQELWTPFSSVASADIAVARHTSLADEMLALGKPVIVDDYGGFPSKVYDYGPEVTAYDYDDIQGKLTRFFADPEGYNASLSGLRKKLYSIPAEPVDQVIQKELMNIWNTVNTAKVA